VLHRITAALKVALTLLGLMVLVVTATPVGSWYARTLAGPWNDPDGDILIVLGADDPNDGYIGAATYWRSVYGARAWREGHFRTIVVCGGLGVAESMRDFLLFERVPADKIVLENRSLSTRENALFVAPLLKNMPGRKVLLTSDFHMYRSFRVFKRVGIEAEPRPIPYALKYSSDWSQRWQVFLGLMIETAKIAVYRLRGWM
jgi:uncharacterized SAM-binding protein YcdF (DUF218 family)